MRDHAQKIFTIAILLCFLLPSFSNNIAAQENTASSQQEASLHCNVGRGTAKFGRKWYAFKDTLFKLRQSQRLTITIPRSRSEDMMFIQALFDTNGQKIIFCPLLNATPGRKIPCSSIYALETDLKDGIKRTFDIPNAIRGGVLSCAYVATKLKSLSVPKAGGQ